MHYRFGFIFSHSPGVLNILCSPSISTSYSHANPHIIGHTLKLLIHSCSLSRKPPNDFSKEPTAVSSNKVNVEKIQGAVPRDYRNVWDVLKYDSHKSIPSQTDLLIIGGGIVGWSAAYWLKSLGSVDVTVVEKDPSYTRSASVFGIGGIRQQFPDEENVQMSLFGAEFIRNIRQHLSVLDEDPPDIQFYPHGYLVTASADQANGLEKSFKMQRNLGAEVKFMGTKDIKARWPWLNVNDIACATYGTNNEGWFDPWLLLFALRKKAATLGAKFVHGEVVGFARESSNDSFHEPIRLREAQIRGVDRHIHTMRFDNVINAAGPWAGEVAKMAGISPSGHVKAAPSLPVEPRIQHVFVLHPKWRSGVNYFQAFSKDTPWLLDYQGLQFKRESFGNDFITWSDPPPAPVVEADGEQDLDVAYNWYEEKIWPQLSHRIPGLRSAQVRVAWAGFYDYNYIDQRLVIGSHPGVSNFLLCNGSSGHGIQHSLAIGLALAEKVLFGRYKTINLERFSFDRFCQST